MVVKHVAMRKASGEGGEQGYSIAWPIPGPPGGSGGWGRCGAEAVVWEQLERNWALCGRAVYTGPAGLEQMLEEGQGGRY